MRMLSFFLGILVLLFCVAVPLPAFDLRMPFSAHMLRHTALLLLAAPLLALAIPPGGFARKNLTAVSGIAGRFPFAFWVAGILVMWVWHVPDLYNGAASQGDAILSCAPLAPTLFVHSGAAASASGPVAPAARIIPLLHDLSLLVAGFLFCWPVVSPFPTFRLPALRAVLYLATACICCSLLGLLITFAPRGTYRGVGLTDQQTGGLIMWVPCCVVYLTASMGLLIRWLSRREPASEILA